MSENPVTVMENAIQKIKHTRLNARARANQGASRQEALKHVCMFENPLPVIENETYTLKHTCSIFM